MATQYDNIIQAKFSGNWAQTHTVSHSSKDEVRYIYINAQAWYIIAYAAYYILGNSGVFQMYISYWNGTAWSAEDHIEVSGVNGEVTRYYGHNRDEGNLSGSYHNGYPLWRIRYWPSRANSNWHINFYAGGCGVQTVNYPQGKHIFSIGRTGTDVNIHNAGTTQTDDIYNGIFNRSNRSGKYTVASCDSELISIPYLEAT